MIQRIRVSGVLTSKNSLLLVSHRKKDDEYWLLPGGGVDEGETLEDALKREFLEETGIHVCIKRVLFLSDTIYPDRSKQIHHIVFEVSAGSGETVSGDDIEQVKFIDFDKLSQLRFYPPFMDKIIEFLGTSDAKYGAEYLGKLWE